MSKYSDGNLFPFGIDVSRWNGVLDWSALKGSPVKWACAKMGELSYADQDIASTEDVQWAANVQGAYDADIPIGGYIFFNPQYYPEAFGSNIDKVTIYNDKQMLAMIKWLTNKKVYFLVLDLERNWISYGDKAATIQPDWILKSTKYFLNSMKIAMAKGYIPDVPVVIYSRKSWIEDYTRAHGGASMYDVTPEYDTWEALYPEVIAKTVQWADVGSCVPGDAYKPRGLNGKELFWQYSQYLSFPVGKRVVKLDANISMRPLAKLYEWMKFAPAGTVIPPVVVPPVVVPPVVELPHSLDALTLRVIATDLRVAELERWRKS